MISINGMISMRARFLGMGEATCINSLIRGTGHRKCDGNFHFRHRPRFEPPPSKGTDRSVIKNGITDALRHARVSDCTAPGVNAHDTNAATRDMPRAGLIRIRWSWGVDGKSLSARNGRHARWAGRAYLRSFNWSSLCLRLWSRWRGSFFMELRHLLWHGRRFRERNILGWRRWLLGRLLDGGIDCERRYIRQIGRRFFVLNRRDHRTNVNQCSAP